MIQQNIRACQVEEGIKAGLKGTSFQTFGLDLLIDEDLKAWILEINDNPSMYIYHEKDYMGGGGEKILSQVDLDVKMKCFGDALNLTNKIFRNNEKIDSFKSYNRIDLQGEVID